MYKEVTKCRICGNPELTIIADIGEQALTGVFPKDKSAKITVGPLQLVKCMEDKENKNCGLVQLKHSYDIEEMYGNHYGYRSSLNKSMIKHLGEKVAKIEKTIKLEKDDIVIDIGSNDGTLLKAYSAKDIHLVGIDPAADKFKKYYPENAKLIVDFFPSATFEHFFPGRKAKVITSIAMFYDIEQPLIFMENVFKSLDDDGIWVCEQSYLPFMLNMNSYDTICHEHLEYYSYKQIFWMTERAGFKIIDIEKNSVNGGSFSITMAKKNSKFTAHTEGIDSFKANEEKEKLNEIETFRSFEKRIKEHKKALCEMVAKLRAEGKTVFGYGASTKGNVILQYCNFTEAEIPFIGEVNEDKFGSFTPQTNIPIISEEDAKKMNPDYFLVLPWHFKDNIIQKESEWLAKGGKFIFPLPRPEIFSL